MESAAELRSTLQQQILNAELEIADAAEREKRGAPRRLAEIRKEAGNAAGAPGGDAQATSGAGPRSRAEREKLLGAAPGPSRQAGCGPQGRARPRWRRIETRLREARGDAGYRGERLRVIDPGIVPERPSSPNLPLNVAAALLLGLVLPILYLTLRDELPGTAGQRAAEACTSAESKARDD